MLITLKSISSHISSFLNYLFLLTGIIGGALATCYCVYIQSIVAQSFISQIIGNVLWLIIALESLKFTTVLIRQMYPQSRISKKYGLALSGMRFLAVTLSLICSLIFFSSQLSSPNRQTVFDSLKTEILSNYELNKKQIIENYDRQLELALRPIFVEKDLNNQNLAIERQITDTRGNFRGKRYEEHLRLKEEIEQREIQRIQENQLLRTQALDSLTHQFKIELEHAKNKVESLLVSGHPVILGFLELLTFNKVQEEHYILTCIILCLIFSVLIEALVWLTPMLLSAIAGKENVNISQTNWREFKRVLDDLMKMTGSIEDLNLREKLSHAYSKLVKYHHDQVELLKELIKKYHITE